MYRVSTSEQDRTPQDAGARLRWQTPSWRKIDAEGAEGSPGNAMDSPVTTS